MKRLSTIAMMIGAVGCGRPAAFSTPPLEALGRRLFFETALSLHEDTACASCHDPHKAFAQNEATSQGTGGAKGVRNAPSLLNVAAARVLTWSNPIVTTLEHQALVPLFGDDPLELGAQYGTPDRLAALERRGYCPLFDVAFPRTSPSLTPPHIAQALAAFERTLVSSRGALDRYEDGEREALSEGARRGYALFHSERLGCGDCHAGRLLSRAFGAIENLDEAFAFNGYQAKPEGDPRLALGLAEFSGKAADRGRFRIPSLRNVARTAPYMHDGGLANLNEVLDHYEAFRRLTLTADERKDLLAFLESLNDPEVDVADSPD